MEGVKELRIIKKARRGESEEGTWKARHVLVC